MTSWILILILSWTNPALATATFSSEDACKEAGKTFDSTDTGVFHKRWLCVPDYPVLPK